MKTGVLQLENLPAIKADEEAAIEEVVAEEVVAEEVTPKAAVDYTKE